MTKFKSRPFTCVKSVNDNHLKTRRALFHSQAGKTREHVARETARASTAEQLASSSKLLRISLEIEESARASTATRKAKLLRPQVVAPRVTNPVCPDNDDKLKVKSKGCRCS